MRIRSLIGFSLALGLGGLIAQACFSPDVKDGAFKCVAAEGFVCPEGLVCDQLAGLCVHALPPDLGATDGPAVIDSTAPGPRTCDQRVQAGAFSNLANLGAVNTAGDERSLALTSDGKRILYVDGTGALMTAALSADGRSAQAPQAVTLTPAAATFNGGSFAGDGSLWFSGTVGGTTAVYQGTRTSDTAFAVGSPHNPMAACAFTDVALTDYDAKKDLYLSYPLAGCGKAPMIAQGLVDKLMGAFVGAVAATGFRSPSVVPGHLTLLMASTDPGARLWYANRATDDVTWGGPTRLPLGSIGEPAVADAEGVVDAACSHLYLVANRDGTKGGLDLWVADIAAQ